METKLQEVKEVLGPGEGGPEGGASETEMPSPVFEMHSFLASDEEEGNDKKKAHVAPTNQSKRPSRTSNAAALFDMEEPDSNSELSTDKEEAQAMFGVLKHFYA